MSTTRRRRNNIFEIRLIRFELEKRELLERMGIRNQNGDHSAPFKYAKEPEPAQEAPDVFKHTTQRQLISMNAIGTSKAEAAIRLNRQMRTSRKMVRCMQLSSLPFEVVEKIIKQCIDLSSLPFEVVEKIIKQLPEPSRKNMMQVDRSHRRKVIENEVLLSAAHLDLMRSHHREALEIAEELNETDMILINSVMKPAREAVRGQFTMDEFRSVANGIGTQSSRLIRLAEETVCVVLPELAPPTPILVRPPFQGLPTWSIEGDDIIPNLVSWHLTYSELVSEADRRHIQLPAAISNLDVLALGAAHIEKINDITGRFSGLVADETFGAEPLSPHAHWATVILLWVRKVSQCCSAAGASLQSSLAARKLKKAQQRHRYWEKSHREAEEHEARQHNDERDASFRELSSEMEQLAHRSRDGVAASSSRREEAVAQYYTTPSKSPRTEGANSSPFGATSPSELRVGHLNQPHNSDRIPIGTFTVDGRQVPHKEALAPAAPGFGFISPG